jgi:hypothetical protein
VGTDLEPAPAFYALQPGGWREYVTLLHWPYTAWHLGYVAIGAALAPDLDGARLAWSLAAFALAVGIAAHFLDELQGRPLRTSIPARVLATGAALSLAGAVLIGAFGIAVAGPQLAVLVAIGAVAVPAYNLEWFGGLIHGDRGFALLWGAFPVLAGYVGQTGAIAPAALAAAAAAYALSLVQRGLSTRARYVRRDLTAAARTAEVVRGAAAAESALRLLAVAVVLVAGALVLVHA